MSIATPHGPGWRVRTEPVGDLAGLLPRLQHEAAGAPLAFGVDAPIGLPLAYAARHAGGYRDFPAFLASLRPDSPFFRVCDGLDEVSPARPFFPRGAAERPRRVAHAAQLGMAGPCDLLRRCDAKTSARPGAAPLFWTLGANQVGKAALSFWRDVLLAAPAGTLWPFAGRLADLLPRHGLAIAEVYPAEAMHQLGLRLAGSKRRQSDRSGLAERIRHCLRRLDAEPSPALAAEIAAGFGHGPAGEDKFDSLLGLLGLLQVLREPERDQVPADDGVRRFEGWILGQAVF